MKEIRYERKLVPKKIVITEIRYERKLVRKKIGMNHRKSMKQRITMKKNRYE